MEINDILFEKLLQGIYTENERQKLLGVLDDLCLKIHILDKIFFIETLKENTNERLTGLFAQFFNNSPDLFANKVDLKGFIEKLKLALEEANVVKISTAILPDPTVSSLIGEWVKENIAKSAVVDLSHAPDILGGCIVVDKGNYLDLSLKTKLVDLFSEKHEFIQTIKAKIQ